MKIKAVAVCLLALAGIIAAATLPAASAQTRPSPENGSKPGDRYAVDPVHSTVIFGIEHMGVGYFRGRINSPSGEFYFDQADSSCSFDIAVKADDVDTHNVKRDNHIKSAAFLDAKQFPEIRFKSTAVQRTGKKTFKVTGDLTLHGVTRPITVDMELIGFAQTPMGYRCGFSTTFTASRSAFGIDAMPDGLGDEVTLMIGIEGVR